ncbi:hypothetical protein L6164_029942 [Bauhinia variegata]|uniref:Uncharacterized protein n=1 Tax=Bauhinia variegata TaxID=167791 RepID=A0ACB9LB89_BAUVA|nr:hypothetical protein L6164_029942 [Bauhinia variegata]
MGFNALTGKLVMAVAIITCISKSTWASKADLCKMWGWSDEDILAAFQRFPQYMSHSENKIEKTMGFFVNQMGCESTIIARFPVLLSLCLKKRIVPRASVIKVLSSKGLLKQLNIQQICYSSE